MLAVGSFLLVGLRCEREQEVRGGGVMYGRLYTDILNLGLLLV